MMRLRWAFSYLEKYRQRRQHIEEEGVVHNVQPGDQLAVQHQARVQRLGEHDADVEGKQDVEHIQNACKR